MPPSHDPTHAHNQQKQTPKDKKEKTWQATQKMRKLVWIKKEYNFGVNGLFGGFVFHVDLFEAPSSLF